MRVLGIDPGLTRCGVGVVEGVPGRPCKLVAYYVVYTEPDDKALFGFPLQMGWKTVGGLYSGGELQGSYDDIIRTIYL